MPRNYQRDPRSKPYNIRSKDDMQPVLDTVRNGLSMREASKKFGIPYSTIQRHVKKKDLKPPGGQTALADIEEDSLVEKLIICGEWGYPIDKYTLRLFVKDYLERRGKTLKKFRNNMPGPEWVYSFLKRHKDRLAVRMCQNIKRARAKVSPQIITQYFDNLKPELEGIPDSNIINYDETNLADDPGRKKVIMKRGCKYPEKVANTSKSATSIMFAGAADGQMLPVYVVYKATNLYDTWTTNGPKNTRYNRTKSGWFDSICYEDWLKSIVIPYCRKLENNQPRIIIGDNLSSHLSATTIQMCRENNIKPIFLPANSTHITQPMDVAFFAPLKSSWRKILTDWKAGPGLKESNIPKDVFPRLLKKLLAALDGTENKIEKNLRAGFKKCGIVPFEPKEVLNRIPKEPQNPQENLNESIEIERNVTDALTELLKEMRYGSTDLMRAGRKKKIHVTPGKSVTNSPRESESETDKEAVDDPSPVSSDTQDDGNSENNDSEDDESAKNSPDESDSEVDEDEVPGPSTNDNEPEPEPFHLQKDDFVIVKFKTNKSTRRFVGKVKEVFTDEIFVSCMRKKIAKNVTFVFPDIKDSCMVKNRDVERKIAPLSIKRGHHHFIVDHQHLE